MHSWYKMWGEKEKIFINLDEKDKYLLYEDSDGRGEFSNEVKFIIILFKHTIIIIQCIFNI